MLAQRISTILPDLSFEEALEITKIYSITGKLPQDNSIITTRPFRNPHHSITATSLVGGGKEPMPGEISLAHLGVLFLDELTEFHQSVLELLRGPLEDGEITISRVNSKLTFPSQFMLLASMNPCPCGYYGSEEKVCTCSQNKIKRYMNKISGPLLDRFDIQIEVKHVTYKNLRNKDEEESSRVIKRRVDRTRKIQQERYKKYNLFSNSEIPASLLPRFCKLDSSSEKILQSAFEKLGLSARAYTRILKVARTIADMEQKENIESKHIAEAIQYRSLDRKYWKN